MPALKTWPRRMSGAGDRASDKPQAEPENIHPLRGKARRVDCPPGLFSLRMALAFARDLSYPIHRDASTMKSTFLPPSMERRRRKTVSLLLLAGAGLLMVFGWLTDSANVLQGGLFGQVFGR